MGTPYPPIRDGIAAYAVQTVARLRSEGNDVEVLSPWPSAAHHHLDLRGPRGPLALAKRVGAYDKVIVQFHPDFFYRQPATAKELLTVSVALTAAFRAANEVEVVVHEVDYRLGAGHGPAAVAIRAMWRSVDKVVVHTDTERSAFAAAFAVSEDRISVEAHGKDFVRRTSVDRAGARIAARVGGLTHQAPAGTVLVDDDDALAAAMRDAAGVADTVGQAAGWDVSGNVDREAVMAEVRARAATRRGAAAPAAPTSAR